ncbi:TetR/AcrR family transcriptional regulator [Actinomadura geliboluensis]|uniref:TetR/AcrR family transcriptional regulator n=1 Tax=Actinomadura geliboluensis TaxID=882440 RepID=UPI0037174904
MSGDGYHHGDLRRTVMAAAVAAIAESGPAGWSLRELARRAGVSHAAPAHHFGDKTGLLTAVAAEGYALFADALEAAGDDLHAVGLAYVRFAVEHRAHFEVMFSPGLYRAGDPEVTAARDRAGRVLAASVRGTAHGGEQDGEQDGAQGAAPGDGDDRTRGIAAWSIVHGFAHLWLSGALPPELGDDPVAAAAPVIAHLFRP